MAVQEFTQSVTPWQTNEVLSFHRYQSLVSGGQLIVSLPRRFSLGPSKRSYLYL